MNIHILEKLGLAMAASSGARLQRKAARTAVSAAAAPSFRRCYGPCYRSKLSGQPASVWLRQIFTSPYTPKTKEQASLCTLLELLSDN
ncbi:hypothetical protein [Mesorhizobium sp.]|uniref:hypothetical protein n=1 Tax=Mesorhizobium sp. TaxID=1871066 RepID=UPI0025C6E92C|nr:hypothetical protein [Mesorhizobium sp.]